ncbi:MAG: futalosine hydrolase [Bacteroidales bacterium]|nr:futalosine hydrolase [Bacteroidales bacterium]
MKILIVSATEKEILPLKKNLKINVSNACIMKYTVVKDLVVDYLVTGIGCTQTTYALTRRLQAKKYDLIIHAGIAGSFRPDLPVGEVVWVELDEFAALGIEDKDSFFTLFDQEFMDPNEFPFTNGQLKNPDPGKNPALVSLKKVRAVTSDIAHGNKASIEKLKKRFSPDIETMEGAAFFYVCLHERVRCMAIRSVSNVVEERNTQNWNIPLAIKNLNNKLLEIINQYKSLNV